MTKPLSWVWQAILKYVPWIPENILQFRLVSWRGRRYQPLSAFLLHWDRLLALSVTRTVRTISILRELKLPLVGCTNNRRTLPETEFGEVHNVREFVSEFHPAPDPHIHASVQRPRSLDADWPPFLPITKPSARSSAARCRSSIYRECKRRLLWYASNAVCASKIVLKLNFMGGRSACILDGYNRHQISGAKVISQTCGKRSVRPVLTRALVWGRSFSPQTMERDDGTSGKRGGVDEMA